MRTMWAATAGAALLAVAGCKTTEPQPGDAAGPRITVQATDVGALRDVASETSEADALLYNCSNGPGVATTLSRFPTTISIIVNDPSGVRDVQAQVVGARILNPDEVAAQGGEIFERAEFRREVVWNFAGRELQRSRLLGMELSAPEPRPATPEAIYLNVFASDGAANRSAAPSDRSPAQILSTSTVCP